MNQGVDRICLLKAVFEICYRSIEGHVIMSAYVIIDLCFQQGRITAFIVNHDRRSLFAVFDQRGKGLLTDVECNGIKR